MACDNSEIVLATTSDQLKLEDTTHSNPKVAFAALHHRDYRRCFSVIMLSQMGDNIEMSSVTGCCSKVSLAGPGWLCRHQSLDALSIFCGVFWRACRPSRLPSSSSGVSIVIRRGLSNVGNSFSYRHDSSVARLHSVSHTWHGRRGGRTGEPAHYP